MSDRPKIHVFLGAPPPSSGPALVSAAGVEGEECPPADWRHLELTWQDGHLRPATDEAGTEEDDRTSRKRTEADRSSRRLSNQDNETDPDLEESSSKADWITETTRAPAGRVGSGSERSTDRDEGCSNHQTPAETFWRQDEESNPKEGDQCSASIQEYLDGCFPAAQPEPGPSAAAPPLSVQTEYLTTWTLSQALILRSSHGIQSATKAPPPQTPPKDAQTPPSISTGSLELFSPLTPSPGASAELFSQPHPTPRAEEGGVVIEATAEGVLCSQEAEQQGPEQQEAEQQEAGQQEAEKREAQQQKAEQQEAEKQEVEQQKAEQQGPEQQEAERQEDKQQKAEQQEAEQQEVEQQEAEQQEAEQQGVEQQEAEQQEATPALTSPSKSPELKKPRISETLRTQTSVVPSDAGLRGPTTLLSRCDKRGVRYSVLVAVVHPCHLKEVKVKSGPAAGTFVPLASIVVTDQSGVEMKVVLWRRAAFWALTVSPGDILLITGLQVNEDRWRGETVLQSTFSSKLLNLGQIAASTSPPVPQHVDARSLSSLCGFLRERRPLLVSLNVSPPQDLNRLPYATLRCLRVNTLVHALLHVTHTHTSTAWRSEAESRCRSAVQLKALLTVEQPDGQQGALLLWGAAVDWLPRFKQDGAAVWDFHVLLVREGLTSDLPELHSTPWSSVRPLDPASRRAQDFLRPQPARTSSSLELDLNTLLSQKYSGDVELRVQVTAFRFQDSPPSQNAPQPVLDSSTPLDDILEVLSSDITYTGCGRCSAELETDANGIYGPCYPCLPATAVRRYYRPGVLTVSGQGSTQVCVQVPPVPLQEILAAPPDRLHRSSAAGSQVKLIQVAAERLQTLLSLPKKIFIITVRSHFLCDENSVPIIQDFTLLDLQFPS